MSPNNHLMTDDNGKPTLDLADSEAIEVDEDGPRVSMEALQKGGSGEIDGVVEKLED